MPPDDVTIRRVRTLDEYDECVRIEQEVWGASFTETVPATILRVSQEVGGVTAAAFRPGGQMLGFVFGMTGVRGGELAHWSDILAIRREARDAGLGTRLKLYQREQLREIGVRTMYWTYDPLVARNAYVNLVRLGARVAEHRIDYYGTDTGSAMHGALGTDRFIMSWDLWSDGRTPTDPARPRAAAPVVNPGGDLRDLPDAPAVRVEIPRDIFDLLDADAIAAHAWRDSTRAAFDSYIGRGYRVAGFERTATGGTYLLERDA